MTTAQDRREIQIVDTEIETEEKDRVLSVLDEGTLADGDRVREFESAFADYCRVDHGVGTANRTAALHAALRALGIGDGDCVVTTPFAFIGTANAVRLCGAEPVFADIDPETFNLDPDAARATIEAREGDVDAILVVHMYGLPAELGAFRALADEYGVPLLEDCSQAHGAEFEEHRVGSVGEAAVFSFSPDRNMTTGEGGMVVTDDETVADKAASFVNHGRAPDDDGRYERLGHDLRMTNLAAAIGLAQLDRLPEYTAARRIHGRVLSKRLDDMDVTVPTVPENRRHVYNQYTIRTSNRDTIQRRLDEFGIDTGVYYPTPIHRHPPYDDVDASLPEAERAAREVLSLPVHSDLSAPDLRTIATAVDYVVNHG